jgi:pimeloyl-ACP methyl ester carboxylesterase
MAERRRPHRSTAALILAAIVAATLAPSTAVAAGPQSSNAQTVGASRDDFAGLVRIKGGRRLYLECRGQGSPTVLFEAGHGNSADIWSFREPGSRKTPVLPAVARYTRVCAYDRPGTFRQSGRPSRSDPVRLPRSAHQIVADLHALLRAAHVPGPYVLVGHSMGGLIARLYAGTYPRQVAGFISIDAAHEIPYEAYAALLEPEQYQAPGTEIDVVATAAAMRRARTQRPLRSMPMVVLEHSRDRKRFPNPFGFPPNFPIAALERAFQAAQDDLASLVPGTRHVVAQSSEHNIQIDQPRLVRREIRRVVNAVRQDRQICRTAHV